MRQKKEQIRSVIEKTGYQPSAQARILLLAGTDNTPAKAFNDDRVEKEPLITDEKLSVAPFGIFSVTCC